MTNDNKNLKNEAQSDVYNSTEKYQKDTNVAIPTEEAVEDAKKWVDDENKR